MDSGAQRQKNQQPAGPAREIASEDHLQSVAAMDALRKQHAARIEAGRRGNEIGAKP